MGGTQILVARHPFVKNRVNRKMKKYRRTNNYICRVVVEKIMLFPIVNLTENFQGAVLLNNVSQYIWDALEEELSQEEIICLVSNKFNITPEVIKEDIEELLLQFIDMDIIEATIDE